jgi:hypothetical protein
MTHWALDGTMGRMDKKNVLAIVAPIAIIIAAIVGIVHPQAGIWVIGCVVLLLAGVNWWAKR